MLTINQKKEKESFYYIYAYYCINIIIFTSKPVKRTTKQVLPMLVAYLNNRVLLLLMGYPRKFDVHNKY